MTWEGRITYTQIRNKANVQQFLYEHLKEGDNLGNLSVDGIIL
jgi:hypothetical protein